MNGRRLGALVVAAILVAAAFVVRRVFLDDDPSVASPTDDAGPVGDVVPVLEEPWHLSYPFLI